MKSKTIKIIGLLIFVMLSQIGISYGYNGIMSKVKNAVLPFNFQKNNNQQTSHQPIYRLVEPESIVDNLKAPRNKPERIAFAKSIGLTGNETAQIAGYDKTGNKAQDMKSAINIAERDKGIHLLATGGILGLSGVLLTAPYMWTKADLAITNKQLASREIHYESLNVRQSESVDLLARRLGLAGVGIVLIASAAPFIVKGVKKIDESKPHHYTDDTIMFKNDYHSTFHFARNLSTCGKGEGRIVQDANILAGPKAHDNNITDIMAADGYSVGAKLIPNKYGDLQCTLYYYRNKTIADRIVRNYFSVQVGQISNNQYNPQITANFIPAGKNLESDIQGKIAFTRQPAYQIISNRKSSGGVIVVDLSPHV